MCCSENTNNRTVVYSTTVGRGNSGLPSERELKREYSELSPVCQSQQKPPIAMLCLCGPNVPSPPREMKSSYSGGGGHSGKQL